MEPAIVETLAIFLKRIARRRLDISVKRRSANGSGPDRNPPMRVSHPLLPRFSGVSLGFFRSSIDAPTKVSLAAAAIPIAFKAGARWLRSSSMAAAAPIPEAAKWRGSILAFSLQTGIAVAPIRTPV